MKTTLNKKMYEKPFTRVFLLQSRTNLLTLSNPGDYGDGGDPMSSSAPEFDDSDILF